MGLNIKNWFNKTKPVSEFKGTQIDLKSGSFLEHMFGVGGTVSPSQAAAFYRNTASVATAVDLIADAIEQIQPVIEDADGQIISDHEIIKLLKDPNGFDSWHNFIGTIARDYLLNHDAIITAIGNVRFSPSELWPVSLLETTVIPAQDRYPGTYLVINGPTKGSFERGKLAKNKTIRFYDGLLKELYHIKGYSSKTDKTRSDSPLLAASNEARQIIAGKTHNLKLLNNGGRLSLLIAFKDDDPVDDDMHKDRVQKINEQYSGANNAGKIGVISNADIAEIKEFGVTNKDMDYGKLESMASKAIFLRYKIPLALVDNTASTFNNLATGVELLYDNAVLPTANIIFAGLSNFLIPRHKLDPSKFKITFNPEAVQPLKRRTLNEVEQRKKIGIESINELRSLLPRRGPIPGGDTIHQASNLDPAGTDNNTSDNNDT